jgi:hypothetical protein
MSHRDFIILMIILTFDQEVVEKRLDRISIGEGSNEKIGILVAKHTHEKLDDSAVVVGDKKPVIIIKRNTRLKHLRRDDSRLGVNRLHHIELDRSTRWRGFARELDRDRRSRIGDVTPVIGQRWICAEAGRIDAASAPIQLVKETPGRGRFAFAITFVHDRAIRNREQGDSFKGAATADGGAVDDEFARSQRKNLRLEQLLSARLVLGLFTVRIEADEMPLPCDIRLDVVIKSSNRIGTSRDPLIPVALGRNDVHLAANPLIDKVVASPHGELVSLFVPSRRKIETAVGRIFLRLRNVPVRRLVGRKRRQDDHRCAGALAGVRELHLDSIPEHIVRDEAFPTVSFGIVDFGVTHFLR